MDEQQSVERLWQRRASAFRKETIPYFRYMAQSGFPAFLSLIFISSAIGYFSLIHNVPPDFPIVWTGILSLTIVVCWSPLRTWLLPADTVFIMPREKEMDVYMRRSFRYSGVISSLLVIVILLLYMPIYNAGPININGWLLAAATLLMKASNMLGGWRERQLAWPGVRILMRIVRWCLTGLVLAVWLSGLLWQAVLFTLLVSLLLLFLYRLPLRHRFPWERLIQEEATTRKRYYLFFGMFIDVPILSSRINKRAYLNGFLRMITYKSSNTFVFLYTASLLRTEIGGIIIRVLMLGCLVTYWAAEAVSLLGWGAVLVFGLFLAIVAVQLGSLRHVHRYSVWKHVYPLPEKQRHEALIKVDRSALAISALLLWLAAALPLFWRGVYIPALTAAGVALIYIGLRASRLRSKFRREVDEDY